MGKLDIFPKKKQKQTHRHRKHRLPKGKEVGEA